MHWLSCYFAGIAASDQEKALQQSLLKHVLKHAAAEASPQLLVDAATVLISAATPSHREPGLSQMDWLQEGDDDLQQHLEDLAQGKRASPLQCPKSWLEVTQHPLAQPPFFCIIQKTVPDLPICVPNCPVSACDSRSHSQKGLIEGICP